MEPMKNHTSLRIGGPADVFTQPRDTSSLKNLLTILKRKEISYLPFGGGTNVLVKDGGIEGAVISLKSLKRIEMLSKDDEYVHLHAEAGMPLQRLVAFTIEHGYTCIEWLVGIPGLLGGAICGNAGAFGSEIKDVLSCVWLMDAQGMLNRFNKEDIHFGYRKSSISMNEIVVAGELRLKKDTKEVVSSRIKNFLRKKRQRQPISELSAGCVFKNPPGRAAGKLIDEAGCKGMRIGDIEVSNVHANFFINKGQGNASDFLRLMQEVTQRVKECSGIVLEAEIKIVGREHVN
jgi:UDP-N-acetylmuramate dehydrogenase